MALAAEVLHALTTSSDADAWRAIIDKTLEIASKPLAEGTAPGEVISRDRAVADLDLFLSSSAWELWKSFGDSIERTSDRLVRWWSEPYSAKAVLILDALSLRELPWLVQGAKEHGFTLHRVTTCASELPGETTEFARALGFSGRTQLQNNRGGLAHKLQPTQTESVDLPWKDCEGLVNGVPGVKNWVFWHHWPDDKLHDYGPGQGLELLTKNAAHQLSSDDFWSFVERLATGRRLVITSDHGYAATGYFPDAEGEVGAFLKQTFSRGRGKPGTREAGPFVPPVALQVNSPHGPYLLALGRRKWRSQSGYPTITHGGLSLLEVLSPFVELTK